jgi:hypothetical protein
VSGAPSSGSVIDRLLIDAAVDDDDPFSSLLISPRTPPAFAP